MVNFTGLLEDILNNAVDKGLAKTKSEALRLAVIELNNKYHLVNEEEALTIRKMVQVDKEVRSGKRKLLSKEAALRKYR